MRLRQILIVITLLAFLGLFAVACGSSTEPAPAAEPASQVGASAAEVPQ